MQSRTRSGETCPACARCWKRSRARPRRSEAQIGIPTPPENRFAPRYRMPDNARTIAELGRALRAHEISAESATTECLDRIAERNPAVNAYIAILADQEIGRAHV